MGKVCVHQAKRKLACFKTRRDAMTFMLLDGRKGLTLDGGKKKRRRS